MKVELVSGIPAGETISGYRQGDFYDLCRGPHVPDTGKLKAFKLLNTAAAYWKGDEKNAQLCRVYGTAFLTAKELEEHLQRLEEARLRDHRKLGRELDLFSFQPEAPASPFFHPKGTVVYNELVNYMRELVPPAGLRRGDHAHGPGRGPVEDQRPLRPLRGEHVLHHRGRAGVRPQAHELPQPLPDLPQRPAQLPGPADPLRGLRPAAPLRALRASPTA